MELGKNGNSDLNKLQQNAKPYLKKVVQNK